jgi:sialidase-1
MPRMIRAAMAFVTIILSLRSTLAADPTWPVATLFQEGNGDYNNYRIPSLIRTAKGSILAFCEGRQTPNGGGNDTGQINLIMRRSPDGGLHFGPVSVVWADGKNTCGNPCPVVDQSIGTIWMLATHNLGEDHEREITLGTSKGARTVWISHSDDDGVTWAPFTEITTQVKKSNWAWYATGPGVGIQLHRGDHAGRLVIPCDYVAKGGGNDNSNSFVIYSDDHGKSWRIGGEPPNRGFNESQVVELSDGRVMLNMRNVGSNRGASAKHFRGVAISSDGGTTFAPATFDETLVEPHCQASIIRDDATGKILFCNPPDQTRRKNFMLRESTDDARTWRYSQRVYTGFSGYSSIAILPEGTIGLLYEAGDKGDYERIDFARIPVGAIETTKSASAVKE